MNSNDDKGNLNNFNKKEILIKEKLYTLFYELTSEIKEAKIEIDEEDYEENIRTTPVFQIIEYIYQSIQILLKKYKKDDIKPFIPNNIEISQYENMLRKHENNYRILIKKEFQNKLHNETLEYKLEEYMEMEDEFEEMKTKFKYEDGKFLENDRKDNEIIIIRQENTNLKKIISRLEKDIEEKNKIISETEKKYQSVKEKLEETEKELNLFSNIDFSNLNIQNISNNNLTGNISSNLIQKNQMSNGNSNNISNLSKTSFYISKNNISEIKGQLDVKILNLKSTKTAEQKNKHIHELFGQNKNIINDMSVNESKTSKNKKSNIRNNSMNMFLDNKKMNLISKYFSNKKTNKRNTNNHNKFNYKNNFNDKNNTHKLNNTCLKIHKIPLNISQNGNLTNRSTNNKTLRRNSSSASQNSKKKVSISKILKNNFSSINMKHNNTLLPNKSSVSFASTNIL
jgi:hypothetical protein